MLDLYCTVCRSGIVLNINITNMMAYTRISLNKAILKPTIVELLAENPKIEIKEFWCPQCRKMRDEKSMGMLCAITQELTQLTNIELIQTEGELSRIFPIKKSKLSDEDIMKKIFRTKNPNIKLTRIPEFHLKREL